MNWRIIEEGEIPSLPLGFVKSAFRIQHEADDELLRHLIQVAKQYIETYTQTLLGNMKVEMTLDVLPKLVEGKGLCSTQGAKLTWVHLPVGPLHRLTSASLCVEAGEWKEISMASLMLRERSLGIPIELLRQGVTRVRLIGQAGLTPVSSMIQGIWLNLVRCLYDSEVVDMGKVRAVLAPLQTRQSLSLG